MAFEDFCLEKRNNPSLTVSSFAARYPDIQFSLANLLVVHQVLDQESDLARKAVAADWPEAGDWFAHYRLTEQIGRGGFSRVFLARDSRVGDREIVLKVTADAVREAHTLGRLSHPHVVPIHHVVDDLERGLTGICMPYLGSATLLDLLDTVRADVCCPAAANGIDAMIAKINAVHPVTDQRALRLVPTGPQSAYADAIVWIICRVAEALASAHALGIVHGDIKPSNILLATGRVPLLLDFNLAQDASATAAIVGGTIAYMAPEQLESSRAPVVNDRTDVFALAAMTYELLTGSHPFPVADSGMPPPRAALDAIRQAHTSGTLRFSRGLVHTHPDVCRIILKALSIDPAERPTADEFSRALKRTQRWVQRIRRWLVKHPRRTFAVVTAVLSLAMAGIAFAVTREPYVEQQTRLAVKSVGEDDYLQAAKHFTNLVTTEPQNPKHLLWRGVARARSNQLDLALQDFTHYEEQTGGEHGDGRGEAAAGYWIYQVQLFNSSKEPMFLIHRLEPAFKKGLRTPELLHDLGITYWRRGKKKEAVEHLQAALAADPTLVEPHIVLFQWELERLGDLSRAKSEDVNHFVQLAETVISKDVPYASIHLQLAIGYGMLARSHIEFESQAVSCSRAAIQNGMKVDDLTQALRFNESLMERLEINGVLGLSALRPARVEFEPVLDPLKREWEQLLFSVPGSK